MKRVACFLGGVLVGALLFAAFGWFGHRIGGRDTPALVMWNLTDANATQLIMHSDRGDSRSLGMLAARGSKRVPLSGGDQAVWLTVHTAANKALESEHVYVDSFVDYFGVILADSVVLRPAL
ncbi:MAG: hypothetical protein ABI787_06880 [Spartobacteria bacterium]